MTSHRKAPLPASMTRHPRLKGVCRWCDKPVLNPKGEPTKGTWHPTCVKEFKLIHWPAETRKAVLARDNGICERCGIDTVVQQKMVRETMRLQRTLGQREHAKLFGPGPFHGGPGANLVPLFWLTDQLRQYRHEKGWPNEGASFWQLDHIRPLIEAHGDITFWQMDNLQTLCTACHIEKGKEDNTRRRQQKAEALQPALL